MCESHLREGWLFFLGVAAARQLLARCHAAAALSAVIVLQP